MTRPRYVALFASVVAATALFGAPLAFADDGHGGRDGGRDGDDHVLVSTQNPAPAQVGDQDDKVNEDNEDNEDNDVVQVAPAQPQPEMEVNELNDEAD